MSGKMFLILFSLELMILAVVLIGFHVLFSSGAANPKHRKAGKKTQTEALDGQKTQTEALDEIIKANIESGAITINQARQIMSVTPALTPDEMKLTIAYCKGKL